MQGTIIYKSRINKDRLLQVPSDERTMFLGLGHLANELSILHKMLLWTSRAPEESRTQMHGRTALELFFLVLLAGKLYEGWRFLKKRFFNGLSEEYLPGLREESQEALSSLYDYFDPPNNAVRTIRNKFAFHYSPPLLDAMAQKVDEELEIYLERGGSANNLYYFATALAGRALIDALGDSDPQAAYLHLIEELLGLARKLLLAADGIMALFLERHIDGLWDSDVEEILLHDLPDLLTIAIPWFTNPTAAYDGSA